MPLLTWKCPGSHKSFANQQITFMHLSSDLKAKCPPLTSDKSSFGCAPERFQDNVGTQLVASATKKQLSVETVQAFGDFCQWHTEPYFQWYDEQGGDAAAAADGTKPSVRVLGQITNVKWTEYFSQWKAEKEDAAAAKARGEHVYTLKKASAGLERMGLTKDDCDRLNAILCPSHQDHLDDFASQFGKQ
jgi:hypothetical protein